MQNAVGFITKEKSLWCVLEEGMSPLVPSRSKSVDSADMHITTQTISISSVADSGRLQGEVLESSVHTPPTPPDLVF